MLSATDSLYLVARAEMERQAVSKYLDAVWNVIAEANRYFAAEEPWAKKKTDPARMATILYVTAECVRQFAILAQPVMPESAAKLLDLLAVGPEERGFNSLGEKGRVKPGAKIPEPQGVFPRYVEPE
jgi:methionyl-tRNA synthetase